MKTNKITITFLFLMVAETLFAQGNFAPANWKAWIGKTFKDEKEIPLLNGFVSQGGTLLSSIDDSDRKRVSFFSKGTATLALFEMTTEDQQTALLDVVAITVQKNQEVKVGVCRDGNSDNPYLMALVEQSKQERWKAIKAWHFNLDKIRVEAWAATHVTCLGIEGED